ncbi:hypothetical protein GCM10022234_29950 [Aeromicrobium panaciterrae]
MTVGDIATWVGSIATVCALGFAGWQLRSSRRAELAVRQAEIKGVAVEWRATVVPRVPDPDGSGMWVYEITVNNPGRLPITYVEVEVTFPVDVRRHHHDGHVGRPVRSFTLSAPVVVAGGNRPWKRRLYIPFESRNELKRTTAVVTFQVADGGRYSNRWPR